MENLETNITSILLTEIDPDAIEITNIRKVDETSTNFQTLKTHIKTYGQREPILVRRYRDNERHAEGTIYGIVDGHHRFAVTKSLNQTEIKAEIIETKNELDDLIRAAGANFTHKSLVAWEMGKILRDIKEKSETKRKLEDIAADFGIARSTAFKYQAAYMNYKHAQKNKNKSITQHVEFNFDKLQEKFNEIVRNTEISDDFKICETKIKEINEILNMFISYKRTLRDKMTELKKSENEQTPNEFSKTDSVN